jgi:hypothetical protein
MRAVSKAKTKTVTMSTVADANGWVIVEGDVVAISTKPRGPGRPKSPTSLFRVVAEKIPYVFLDEVRNVMITVKLSSNSIYIAHDCVGYPRYVGRGAIFTRLKQRKTAQVLELCYFSFYVVADKNHEREIETIMIRAAGPILDQQSESSDGRPSR